MFCKNCGKELPAGIRFCPGCGTAIQNTNTNNSNYRTPQQTETYGASTLPPYLPPKPKKSRKPLVLLGAGVLAIVLVAFVIFKIFFSGNPISNTVMAAAKLKNMTGANVSIKYSMEYKSTDDDWDYDYSNSAKINAAFKLGKDMESSILDATVVANSDRVRIAFYDGDLAGQSDGNYIYVYDAIDKLQDMVDEGLKDSDIDLDIDVNDLIKNGKINEKYIRKLLKEMDIDDDVDKDFVEGVQKIVTDFIFKECNKKKVQKKFISGYKRSGNTYSYSIDTAELGAAFLDYVVDCKKSGNAEVKKAAKELLKDVDDIDDVKDELEEQEGNNVIDVSYSTKSGRLATLEIAVNTKNRYSKEKVKFSIKIENYNKPDIDSKGIEKFMEKAEDRAEDFEI